MCMICLCMYVHVNICIIQNRLACKSWFHLWCYLTWSLSGMISMDSYGHKPHFHLYMYDYVCISTLYQDRLEHRKCFHSCICMCVIHFDHYQELFKRMMHIYIYIYISWHGLCQCPPNDVISDMNAPCMHHTATDKWKHSHNLIKYVCTDWVVSTNYVHQCRDLKGKCGTN